LRAPQLFTPRLELRHPAKEDYLDYARLWSDPDVIRYLGGQPRDNQDSWLTLARQAGFWGLLGYGYWTVRRRSDGAYLGEVGFADYQRGLTPDLSGRPEAGWVLARRYWGQGYASEAVRAMHDWMDETCPGPSHCVIEPDHEVSIHLAQKFGYQDVSACDYKGQPIIIFERQQPAASGD